MSTDIEDGCSADGEDGDGGVACDDEDGDADDMDPAERRCAISLNDHLDE